MGRRKKAAGDEQMCRRKFGKGRCKNASVDNELGYCEKHYKVFEDFCRNRLTKKKEEKLKNTNVAVGCSSATGVETRGSKWRRKEDDRSLDHTSHIQGGSANVGTKTKKKKEMDKKKLPQQYCCQTAGWGWRCKNFRMGHGAAADDDSVPKTKYCEKHYNYYVNYYKNLKKRSRDGEGAGCSTATAPVEIRGSKRRQKIMDQSLDETGGILLPTTDTFIESGSANIGTKRKRENVQRTQGSGELDSKDLLTEYPSLKKETEKKKKKLHPNEKYCYMTGGGGWRCKNFSMSYGTAAGDDSVPKTRYCEKHYNLKFLQKRRGDGEGATGPVEIRSSKRMKKVTEEDKTGEIHPDTSNTIIEGGDSAKIGTKRKTVEQTERSGDLKSLTKIREPVVELESLEHYKSKCFELCVELEKQKVELEKKNAEFTTLQGKYPELEIRKTAAKAEDAVEYWKNKCSDLDSLVLKMETENSAMRCEVSCVSNLQSLVPRSGKENSILRCEEFPNSEKIESEVRGWQNEITETGENQREKDNMSTLNAESSSGGRKDSCVYEFKTKEKMLNVHGVCINKCRQLDSGFHKYSAMNISSGSLHLASGGENVEEGKSWGCSEGRPFQHGSSSQDNPEMSKKTFVNLVSDSDDESENPLGDPLDMLATKNWNRNKHEMKWKSEADMLSSFEADPVLCMRAVCALCRQEISEDEISPKGLVIDSDTLRCTTLAKFLMDKDCKGDLIKSMEELEKFDSKAVGDCRKLVRRYSIYLFDIYANRKDPFFLPATTAGHGDQTAK